jgi:hypothetical protein
MSGGAFPHAYAPPSLCFAEGEGEGDPGVGAAAAGAGGDVLGSGGTAGTSGTGAAGDPPGLSSLADGGSDPPAPPNWPEDWRERLAGNNDGFGKLLKRFASPENFARSYTELRQKVSAPPTLPTLPENPTEEQVAEYRKAIGIPETPDGYGIKFDESLGATEADNEMLQGFLAHMHGQHIPPAHAQAAFGWYQQWAAEQRDKQVATAQRERARITNELRKEYGGEYKRNLGLADEFLTAYPGIAKYVNPNSPDLEFTRDIIALARATAPEDALYSGDSDAGGKGLDEQIQELRTKSITGRLTDAEDAKYNRLLQARMARDAKKQNRAA